MESFKFRKVLSNSRMVFCNCCISSFSFFFSLKHFAFSTSLFSLSSSICFWLLSSVWETFLAINSNSRVSVLLSCSISLIFNFRSPFSWLSLLSFFINPSIWDRKRERSLAISRFETSSSNKAFNFISYSVIFKLRSFNVASFCDSVSLRFSSASFNFTCSCSTSLFIFDISSSSFFISFSASWTCFCQSSSCLLACSSSVFIVAVRSFTVTSRPCFSLSSLSIIAFCSSDFLFKLVISSLNAASCSFICCSWLFLMPDRPFLYSSSRFLYFVFHVVNSLESSTIWTFSLPFSCTSLLRSSWSFHSCVVYFVSISLLTLIICSS